MSSCPSRSELQLLTIGGLNDTRAAAIESHADHCEACIQFLKANCEDAPVEWQMWAREHEVKDVIPSFLIDETGRYAVRGKIGRGGFGTVYRCYDQILKQDVAIKVPHASRIVTEKDLETFLDEARRWIRLDHPSITRFLHADCVQGSAYLVTKYVSGGSLKQRLARLRPSFAESAAIVAQIARALHHLHEQGLYHRDVKPSNILLDEGSRALLTDFGLALSESEIGTGMRHCGTLRYLSPEQAGGEGHFVDGRTDIYSLGVVLYELLTGSVPFISKEGIDVREQIIRREPRPPRMIDDCIPRELERICLKAMSKRLSQRYSTAGDMAEELERWQEPAGSPAALQVVPKGLRSFDAEDAEFFLNLLPGPRHRDGMPESIRFWKMRIEQTDPDQTFRVGLISGPSGCGKTSMVNAGLLPTISDHVVPVYLEADGESTEARLQRMLHRRCAELSPDLRLVQSIAAIRTGRALTGRKKLLIVIDQFEQWLQGQRVEPGSELVKALRQCDGGRAQAIIMVRDDFATAVRRFMHQLDVPIVEYENFLPVDLFDMNHAREVLTKFGQAYRQLPADGARRTIQQERFVERSVRQLAQDGMVMPVRLALFAYMVRGCAWGPATLDELGGVDGIGFRFLEDAFSRRNPEHLKYEKAARQVLKELLPNKGMAIRGKVQPRSHLFEIAECGEDEFKRLIRILDVELRLITPTERDSGSASPSEGDLYQLTHDFMVPPLRRWLTRHQRKTRRGRAELCLEERTSEWIKNRERRFLPTFIEWMKIVLWTRKLEWNAAQRKMMVVANRQFTLRALLALSMILVIFMGGVGMWVSSRELRLHTERESIVNRIVDGNTAQTIDLIENELEPHRPGVDATLQARLLALPPESRGAMHVRLALLGSDTNQLAVLSEDLLRASPTDLPPLRQALYPHRDRLTLHLWPIARDAGESKDRRFRALAALAEYDPPDNPEAADRWASAAPFAVEYLLDGVLANASDYVLFRELFRKVKRALLGDLRQEFLTTVPERRLWATTFLSDLTLDMPAYRARLVMDGDERQFRELMKSLETSPNPPLDAFRLMLAQQVLPQWDDPPLPPSSIDKSLQAMVQESQGMLHDQFVLCQSARLNEFKRLNQQLRDLGCSLVRCRPYGQRCEAFQGLENWGFAIREEMKKTRFPWTTN